MFKATRLPPKGSFSTAYSSLSRKSFEDFSAINETSSPEVDLSQELSEMCSFTQVALKKTSEVQEDISRLLTLFETEKVDLQEVSETNTLLLNFNFPPLPESLGVKSLLPIIRDLLDDLNLHKQQLSEIQSKYSELEEILKNYSKNLQSSYLEVQSLKHQLHDLTIKTQSKTKKNPIFKSPNQKKEENEIVSNLMEILSCSKNDLPEKLKSLEVVLRLAPKLERFVSEICKEFVPELDYENDSQVLVTGLKQVFERIHAFKAVLQDLINFKIAVFECFEITVDRKDEVLNELKEISIFKKQLGGNSMVQELKNWEKYLKSTQEILERVLELFGVKNAFTDFHLRETIMKHLKAFPI
jgi:DNA repair ATPase RecN